MMGIFGLIVLTVLIFLLMIMFYAGLILDFIKPSAIQIQLLGVNLLLFGIVVLLLTYDGPRGFGFVIGLLGLATGVFGSFRESDSVKNQVEKGNDTR
jgi:hypothetical protein